MRAQVAILSSVLVLSLLNSSARTFGNEEAFGNEKAGPATSSVQVAVGGVQLRGHSLAFAKGNWSVPVWRDSGVSDASYVALTNCLKSVKFE